MIQHGANESLAAPERFAVQYLTREFVLQELARVASKTKEVAQRMTDPQNQFPSEFPVEGKYPLRENIGWTEGFWTGINWLLYEATTDSCFKEVAEAADLNFVHRIENRIITDHHDLGFLYSLSTIAEYDITDSEKMREASILAAETLLERYWPKAGVIQAWGDPNDPSQQGRMIMDCCMNLPLLYWASEETGDPRFKEAAMRHIQNAADYLVREDGSTYHTFYMDVETGQPKYGSTHQGYSDDSCWARGEAWGIYGFALSYRYLKDPKYLELSKKLVNYFMNRLPEDLVCQWDLIFYDEPDSQQPRDTSSMTIAICGMLEIMDSGLLSKEEYQQYQKIVASVMKSLADNYATTDSEGFLESSVYNKPKGNGVNVPSIWGDYSYLDALVRLSRKWPMYW